MGVTWEWFWCVLCVSAQSPRNLLDCPWLYLPKTQVDKWRIERIQKNGSCLSISRYGRRRMGPLEKYKRPVEGVMSSKIFSGIRQQKDTGGKITWPSVSSAGECESTWRQTLAATCRVWYYWLTYQCRFFFSRPKMKDAWPTGCTST